MPSNKSIRAVLGSYAAFLSAQGQRSSTDGADSARKFSTRAHLYSSESGELVLSLQIIHRLMVYDLSAGADVTRIKRIYERGHWHEHLLDSFLIKFLVVTVDA